MSMRAYTSDPNDETHMYSTSKFAPGSLRTRYFEREFVESLRDADLVFAVPTQQSGSPYLLYPARAKTQEPLGHDRTAQALHVAIDLLTDDLYALVSACLKIKGECFFQPTSREFEAFLSHEYRWALQVEVGQDGVKDCRGSSSLSVSLAVQEPRTCRQSLGDLDAQHSS
jgi:hypothetical protein